MSLNLEREFILILQVARRNGLTPFSVYQGRWNAAYRDMEAEIVPMCEDQGMAIMTWGSLGGGQLATAEHRRKIQEDPDMGGKYYVPDDEDVKVCDVLERIASDKKVTLQSVVSDSGFSELLVACC